MHLIHTNALHEAFIKLSHYCSDNIWFTNIQSHVFLNNAEVAKYYLQSLSDIN
jgi:hypothetical protein